MKISVIISCYNEKNTIEEIVAAVRRARVSELEIIVVGGSTTRGAALLEEKIEANLRPAIKLS